MADNEVVLLDYILSTFGIRVRIALAEKGIEYEYKEQDLVNNKSALLLEMNPIYKKIPVLIHNGKPICESLIIVEYIDEVWKNNPLLPTDPYERAQARFWAKFVDDKVHTVARTMWLGKDGEHEAEKKELIENLKHLADLLGDKPYFGGEKFGFVDIALIPFYKWFYMYEKIGKFNLDCPKIIEWAERCLKNVESVAKFLSDENDVYDLIKMHRKKIGVD
ncbi:hypothetical protein TanjilG_29797 [Lupinus angustifolius]|uniref:Glutathione S-transferase n=1 Tax=Lupinus angustifolius TaxID=3871 RepID=A0A394DMU4_LUPAN|nr:PREDICTED: probable glutathione S-transferase [Lupinus angustifolius]OIW21141.1 hypothetical protein TanjilG_29797 [Lupinus angustifolius]